MSWMTLQLTDGTTTIDLVDGVNYALVDGGWAPAVAPRRVSRLGGRGEYEDVVEEITVNIFGDTAAACLSKLLALSQMLDTADAYSRGRAADPVTMRVKLQGSSLTNPLEALVLGRADDRPLLQTAPTFNDQLLVFEIEAVTIRLRRRGVWLGDLSAEATAAGVNNPAVLSATLAEGAQSVPGPTIVKLTGFSSDATEFTDGFVLLTDHSEGITLVEAESASKSASASVVDESSLDASNDDVVDFPSDTLQSHWLQYVFPTALAGVESLSVVASVRIEAGSGAAEDATWQVRAATYDGLAYRYGRWATFDATSEDPAVVYLGKVAHPLGNHAAIRIDLDPDTTVSGHSIRVDWLACIPHATGTRIFQVRGDGVRSEAYDVVIDPRPLSALRPISYADHTSVGAFFVPLHGDAYIETAGATVEVMLAMPKSSGWVFTNNFAAVQDPGLSVQRYAAYLVPQ